MSWTIGSDGYTVRNDAPLTAGNHSVAAGTSDLDLAGLGLAADFSRSFNVSLASPQIELYSAPFPGISSGSTIDNPFGFYGLHHDSETGFVYARNRYYDPEMGRFLTTDPMGYTDGPNLYQYALNDSVNFSDPTGEVASNIVAGVYSVGVGFAITCVLEGCENYSLQDGAIDFALGFVTHGLSSVGGLRHLTGHGVKGVLRAGARATAEVGLDIGAEYVRDTIDGKPTDLGSLAFGAFINQGIGQAGAWGGRRFKRAVSFDGIVDDAVRAGNEGAREGVEELLPRFDLPRATPNFKPFTYNNFRRNLELLTGGIPEGAHAHHVFPQKFTKRFATLGIDVNDPRYGAWWEGNDHLSKVWQYNEVWEAFLATDPSAEQAIQFG